MEWSANQLFTLDVTVRVTAFLSLLCIIVILVDVMLTWSRLSSTPNRIIVWWVLASTIPLPMLLFGQSPIPINSSDQPSLTCILQGSFITYGYLASTLWAGFIAHNIFLAAYRKIPLNTVMKCERIYHVIAWLIPLFITLMPIMMPTFQNPPFYGDAELYCWISESWISYRYLYFALLWILFAFIIVMYALVGLEVRRSSKLAIGPTDTISSVSKSQGLSTRSRFLIKTCLYLGAYLMTFVWATINRTFAMITGYYIYSLLFMQAISIPSIGIFSAIAYFSANTIARTCKTLERTKDTFLSTLPRYSSSVIHEDWLSDPYVHSTQHPIPTVPRFPPRLNTDLPLLVSTSRQPSSVSPPPYGQLSPPPLGVYH